MLGHGALAQEAHFAGSAPAPAPMPLTGLPAAGAVPPLAFSNDPAVGSPIALTPVLGPTLQLSASLGEENKPVSFGLVWRIYDARPDENGRYRLVTKTDQALPTLSLDRGEYLVHAAYGRASALERIALSAEPVRKNVQLNAGGLRLWVDLGGGPSVDTGQMSLALYSSEPDEYGDRKLIVPDAKAGKVMRLNAGTYQIVSHYGDGNAIVRGDVKVEAGQITDATIAHRAGQVTLKLVTEPGGEALADTAWTVLTPGGDVVKEAIGAFPTYVLAEGKYEAVARHDAKVFNKTFSVEAGSEREVELVAR